MPFGLTLEKAHGTLDVIGSTFSQFAFPLDQGDSCMAGKEINPCHVELIYLHFLLFLNMG